jgi:hypothetical protein
MASFKYILLLACIMATGERCAGILAKSGMI